MATHTTPMPEAPTRTLTQLSEDFKRPDRAAAVAVLMVALADVFANDPSIRAITACGYTPSFNDGEPCRHGEEHAVNHRGIDDRAVMQDGSMVYTYKAPANDAQAAVFAIADAPLTPSQEEARAVVRTLPWEAALDTNWTAHASVQDGQVVLVTDYYSCDY